MPPRVEEASLDDGLRPAAVGHEAENEAALAVQEQPQLVVAVARLAEELSGRAGAEAEPEKGAGLKPEGVGDHGVRRAVEKEALGSDELGTLLA